MRDLLTRLQHALPAVEAWVSELHARHVGQSPANSRSLSRLSQYFPTSLLQRARAVTGDVMPFPPVRDLGLPEFEDLAAMDMAGITFGHMYFLQGDRADEATHFHELVHVVQWSALGVRPFLLTYAVGIAQHGYETSPLEVAAYDFQAKFERGEAIPGLVDFIGWHAEQVRGEVEELFRSVGMTMGAPQRA